MVGWSDRRWRSGWIIGQGNDGWSDSGRGRVKGYLGERWKNALIVVWGDFGMDGWFVGVIGLRVG